MARRFLEIGFGFLLVACATGAVADGTGLDPTQSAAGTQPAPSTSSSGSTTAPLASPDADAGPSTSSSGGSSSGGTSSSSSGGTSSSSSGGTSSSSSGGTSSFCSDYADPNTFAFCTACGGPGKTCQFNGCYNGYYCDTFQDKCVAPPPGC